MANNNPQVELLTIWGFTEEEVRHRWDVAEEFNPINRLFGSSDDPDNGAKPASGSHPSTIDQDRTLSILERLLPAQGE